jgi:hypothetical protein
MSLVASATLGACAQDYVTLHHRLWIAVRIAGRAYEGVSVLETVIAYWGEQGGWFRAPEAGSLSSRSWGEAVVVDLGQHGLLFGLLHPLDNRTGDFGINGIHNTLFSFLPRDGRGTAERIGDLQRLQGEFHIRPTLVRFRDVADPTTFEIVDVSRFAETYGSDSSFGSATISITQDPITRRIDKVLPWLATQTRIRQTDYLSAAHFKVDGD